jgi:hypothetical protein
VTKTIYTLTVGAVSVAFTRQTDAGFERWFAEDGAYTANKILRGTSRRVVIDTAGAVWPKLTIRAEFATLAAVATCRTLARGRGTLSNTRGRGATIYLATIAEPESDSAYGLTLDLTFERLS